MIVNSFGKRLTTWDSKPSSPTIPPGVTCRQNLFSNMYTNRDSSCAYRESHGHLSRRSSLDDRHAPPILGRDGPFSESKNMDFRGRVYEYANQNRRRLRIPTRRTIERAADCYDCNKTKAVVSACNDVPTFV